MSTTTAPEAATAHTPSAETLAAVVSRGDRPARPSALSASLTFDWRAILKIKHVPEQLSSCPASW
ncbi:hypothetical protein GCM10020358_01010 [Amorphoplanes nipponensis]|uniref:Uncharacterized protein n=1 Tax=Actinoplanes nipponensis TaxID=135950 RepID=A0A919MSL0_9ACTN|nr:hypothetical protein Ani05nite_17040 [Actinoplanes nipponensis]